MFPGIEYKVSEVEPPGSVSQSLKCFRNLAHAKRLFEGFACLRPGAARERIVAGKTFRWPCRRHAIEVQL
jgi:hypothetical protein